MAATGLIQHFWARVDQSGGPDACWPWTASLKKNGYGQVWIDGKPAYAHRFSWELAHGPVPNGLKVLHSCDNPPCVNQAHLFLGTSLVNSADMVSKGRQARGEQNGMARLGEREVIEIRTLREAGYFLREIAERMGVSIPTVHQVLTGRTWSHA